VTATVFEPQLDVKVTVKLCPALFAFDAIEKVA
jgi:hypothetical protein